MPPLKKRSFGPSSGDLRYRASFMMFGRSSLRLIKIEIVCCSICICIVFSHSCVVETLHATSLRAMQRLYGQCNVSTGNAMSLTGNAMSLTGNAMSLTGSMQRLYGHHATSLTGFQAKKRLKLYHYSFFYIVPSRSAAWLIYTPFPFFLP